jgi:hypothetical protein
MKTGKFTTRHTERRLKLLHDEAKEKIEEIVGSKIRFDGHFNKVFDELKAGRQEQLLKWIADCKSGSVSPISSDRVAGLLGFIFKFRDTNFRAILTKKKNEYFIALFLDKHKYYENERDKLGI